MVDSGIARILKLPGHSNYVLVKAAHRSMYSADQSMRSAEKFLTIIFQLPGWTLVAPS